MFLQRWDIGGDIAILFSNSPFSNNSPENCCHINAPEAQHKREKTESNKVLCGYAADYDPELKENRENTFF